MINPELINKLQIINGQVSDVLWTPRFDEYPTSLTNFQLPSTLTEVEQTVSWYQGNYYAQENIVIRCFFEEAQTGDYMIIKEEIAGLQRSFLLKYLDPVTYHNEKFPLLIAGPIRAEIIPTAAQVMFTQTGYQVLEYPVGSEYFFHGFEMRFQVRETWDWSCIVSLSPLS